MDKSDELGGLWLKESQAGVKFMSGKITVDGQQIDVVLFKNTFKKPGENTPDYRLYRSRQRQEQAPAPRGHPALDALDDEVPF